MKNAVTILLCILTWCIIFIQTSCTENPFGSEDISLGKREITGNVVLSDSFDAEGVYVWLEGFNIGSRTNEKGEFKLVLPVPSAQGSPGGITGAFNLYFYMANYELNSVFVSTRNGEFVYSNGVLNKNGQLIQPVKLENFLKVRTVIEPDTITSRFAGPIDVKIHLRTPLLDSATVVFPANVSIGRPFGTIILRRLDSGELYHYRIDQGQQNRNSFIVGHAGLILSKPISTVQGVLPLGKYEAIPHLLIQHQEIPADLIQTLGANFSQPNTDYLKMPIRREGGSFVVAEE